MPMIVIRPLWVSFRDSTMAPDAGPVQRQETRRAFYAGVFAMHSLMESIGAESTSDGSAFKILNAVKAELEAFLATVHREADAAEAPVEVTAEGRA